MISSLYCIIRSVKQSRLPGRIIPYREIVQDIHIVREINIPVPVRELFPELYIIKISAVGSHVVGAVICIRRVDIEPYRTVIVLETAV